MGSSAAADRPRVLFIEDNAQLLDLYSLVLDDEFEVLRATRGEEAYRLACSESVHAVIADILLPDVDGLDVCRRIRANQRTAHVPLIVLTGDDQAHARALLRRAELDGILTKPCSGDRLLSVLRTALRTAPAAPPRESPHDDLVHRYYDWFNARRFSEAAALFSDDAVFESGRSANARGTAGYMEFALAWIGAFPDGRLLVDRIDHRSDALCEVRLFATGTHTGVLDFGEYRFRPSGADIRLHVRELLEIRDGQIVSSSVTVDPKDLIRQLSLVNYAELTRRLGCLATLREELARADDEPRRHDIATRIGGELDGARRALRPHFYK
jgi:DNA-binding response OmpR family regulator